MHATSQLIINKHLYNEAYPLFVFIYLLIFEENQRFHNTIGATKRMYNNAHNVQLFYADIFDCFVGKVLSSRPTVAFVWEKLLKVFGIQWCNKWSNLCLLGNQNIFLLVGELHSLMLLCRTLTYILSISSVPCLCQSP